MDDPAAKGNIHFHLKQRIMHPLTKKIARLLEDRELLPDQSRCLVAVSGGADSMALLHLLAELAPLQGVELVVAHVDHGLRPTEAEQERALVAATAERLGLPFVTTTVLVREHARSHGLSIEHAARELRYDFLEQQANELGAARLAVGHTADDQAEELLLRLLRGSGRAGLAGMALLRDDMLLRPLLTTTREEILAYLTARRIEFCEDSSNQDRRFLRNRVRLDLLPLLAEEFNPRVRQTLRETATILQDEEELLAALTVHACKSVITEEQRGDDKEIRAQLPELLAQPQALQRRVLEAICWRMDCRPSFRQIEQLRRLASSELAQGKLHLAQGLRADKEGKWLRFSYPLGRQPLRGNLGTLPTPPEYRLVIPGPGEYTLPALGQLLQVLLLEPAPDRLALSKDGLWVDSDKVVFPLELRPFRPGERFRPLGAPGSKKVGDFLTDQKIPPADRHLYPVLADQQGILGVVGLRPDQRAALHKESSCHALLVRLVPVGPAGEAPQNGFTGGVRHGI